MRKNNALWGGLAFLTPQLIGLIFFAVIPLVSALVLSFMKWDGFGGERSFVGLDNFIYQLRMQIFGRQPITRYYIPFLLYHLEFYCLCYLRLL